MKVINTIIYVSVIVISIFAFYVLNKGKDKLSEIKVYSKISERNKKIIYYVLLMAVFLVGTIIRLYEVGEFPRGINVDEAMGTVDAYAHTTEGTDRYGM